MHSFGQNAGSEGCFGALSDSTVAGYIDGIPKWSNPAVKGSGAYHMQNLFDKYKKEWNIYNGYEFNMRLQGRIKP